MTNEIPPLDHAMPNTTEFDYATLVSRNQGYIAVDLQQRIRDTTLLIAGCGIGSSLAICAARLGFEKFILVDADTVSASNLNRQFYDFADVGQSKVTALQAGILRINPKAQVEARNEYLSPSNTAAILAGADLIFDTVDFLDLPAILGLHRAARQQGKPILTALSVGFGALVWYFPGEGGVTLEQILSADTDTEAAHASGAEVAPATLYARVFERFIARLAPYLDQEVNQQIGKVLAKMRDGQPCPASQVAAGSFAIGAMALSMIRDILAGQPVPTAPSLVVHSFHSHKSQVVTLA